MQWQRDWFPNFDSYVDYVVKQPLPPTIRLHIIDSVPENVAREICNSKNTILLTSNTMMHPVIPENRIVSFPDSWYGIYSGDLAHINRTPSKAYNCFINRMDPTRQSWAYQLIRRQLFDKGFISFNMDISNHIKKKQVPPGTEPLAVFEQQFKDYCAIFQDEHEILKKIVPYRNFADNALLSNIILDSKFSIVLETYHHDNNFITFSEKIFRCLKLPRPWVVHAERYAVAQLRRMGFDVLDDIVNHSYDTIEFTIDRQAAILNQCEKLCEIDLDQHMDRLEQAVSHNNNILNQFAARWHLDIIDSIDKAHKLLA